MSSLLTNIPPDEISIFVDSVVCINKAYLYINTVHLP